MTDKTFLVFREFIEGNLGIKMPPAKKVMLETRLGKRMRALKIPTYEDYCEYVFSKEGFEREVQQLVDVVTTNETDFFRENHHFDYLTEAVLPELIVKKGLSELNLWSVAASTGQESYTLAMVLETFMRTSKPFRYRILGTDISETVLRIAHAGIYTEHQAAKIPTRQKKEFCLCSKDPEEKTIRFKPEIREKIMFRKLNLMDSSYPINRKYQVIFCRNVFIYFDRTTQHDVLHCIHEHLAPGGFLFMGHSENIGAVDLPLKSVSAAVYRDTRQE